MKIYLIRHGRQNTRLCNVDAPLSKEGHEQAKLLGERMKSWGVEALYSSTLQRARGTAEELNSFFHVPIHEYRELEEIDFGELTGKSDEENQEKYKFFFEKKKQMKWDLEYPGGENNEQVFQRGMPVIQEIAQSGYKKVAVVTHGGLIRAIVCGILEIPFSRVYQLSKIMENTAVTQLEYDEENDIFLVQCLNDYAHLEGHDNLLRQAWKE